MSSPPVHASVLRARLSPVPAPTGRGAARRLAVLAAVTLGAEAAGTAPAQAAWPAPCVLSTVSGSARSPAPPLVAPPAGCATVAVKRIRASTGRRPKARGRRTKGIGVRLTLDRGAHLDLVSATLSYARSGRPRTATLRTKDITTRGRATLRFRLPGRLARKLELGRHATLTLRLRVRPIGRGCSYGAVTMHSVSTRVTWVP